MGTPDFAIPSLKALVDNGYNVVGVITAPDREAGRGRVITMSAVKKFAIENKLNVLQPHKLKNIDFIDELKNLQANLQIVVAFRMLPEIVWAMPELGTFNLHASLLPQYRGAAPINFAIINGEKVTGLTTFFLDKEIDTGRIIYQEKIKISNNDDAGSLHDKMMEMGAGLVLKTVSSILDNIVAPREQKELVIKNETLQIAPKLLKENCRIHWNNTPLKIYNFVRGLSPYPASYTILSDENGIKHSVKIFKVSIVSQFGLNKTPGKIVTDGKTFLNVEVETGDIGILELQLPGKKRMGVSDFLRGFQHIDDFYFE